MRIGILGGTFNPPHLAHLVCAQEAYVHLELDRVVFVPARVPPHKPVEEDPGCEHRLALCQLAVRGDERFEVSDLEIVREGTSYTVDTLQALTTQALDHALVLIVGGDIAAGLPDWRAPDRVLSLATLAVAERPGTEREVIDAALRRVPGGERARFFPMPTISISSSAVRERVHGGLPIKYLVPDPVVDYIHAHGLYGGDQPV